MKVSNESVSHLNPNPSLSHTTYKTRFLSQVPCIFSLLHFSKTCKLWSSQLRFLLPSIIQCNYDNKQQTLKHRNTQNGSKSTNLKSQTMTYWTRSSKLLFPKGSAKVINSSENSVKRQLAFELQNLHVYEKHSKPDLLFSSYLRCCIFTSGGSSLPPSLLPVYVIDPSLISLLIFLLWCRDPDNLFCFACYRL